MSSTVGNDAILAMLSNLDRDALHSAIAKFIQHELDEMKEKVALLDQQGSQQAELLRLQQVQTDPCTWDDANASSRNFKD